MRRGAERALRARGPKRALRTLAFAAGLAALAAYPAFAAAPGADAATGKLDEREALRLSQSVVGTRLPEHTLTAADGRAVRLADYRGRPLLVSFIYTGCFQVCPTQTRALHEAVRGLDKVFGAHQFNVVSIGFNQPYDSPAAMRAFAAKHGIAERNWSFLSPSPAGVAQLARDFGFSWRATPAGFDHLLGVTVVDAEGRIHAQVYGDKLNAAQLGEPLRRLLSDAPLPEREPLEALLERARILCTVYDPETGAYRYDYKLFAEIAGGLLFFISVLVYLLVDRVRRRREAAPRVAHS